MKNVIYWSIVASIAAVVISQYEWNMALVVCFMWWAIGVIIKDQYKDHVLWKKLNND